MREPRPKFARRGGFRVDLSLWKRADTDWTSCIYCGDLRQTADHIPAVSSGQWIHAHHPEVEFVVVPACKECNLLLGNLALWNVQERAAYLCEQIRARYAPELRVPDRTEAEILTFAGNLRRSIRAAARTKAHVLRRLEHLALAAER